ncbi:MAG TPA: TonB-dependent receptor, partial [Flavisolibacter sp.]
TSMGAIGIGNTTKLSERSFLKSTIALVSQKLDHKDDTLNKSGDHFNTGKEKYNTGRLSFSSAYHLKFSPIVNMKTGVYASNIHYGLNRQQIDFNTGNMINPINSKGNSLLLQPYWQMNFKPGKWTVNPGLHLMYLGLNKKTTLDPRLSVQYKISPVQNISLAYGLHSKMLPIGSYFFQQGPGYPNKNLDMMRSHHFILAFDRLLGKGWRFSAEAYYQRLFNIPIINDENRTFWILNELEGYATQALVSKGKGTNKGIDLVIEKFFNKGLFTIAAFSIFRSTYQPLNGKEYNTRFNSGSTGSWTGAKEWKLKKNKVIQVGWKMIYNGGLPLTPLANIQNNSREAILDESRPYSEKVPAYFRTDARISLLKNKVKSSWQLAIDIQNVLGLKNTDGLSRRYDPSVNQWIYKEQSGFVPILSYQVDF